MFSFVVEGNANDQNMDGEAEMKAVQDAVQALFQSGSSAGLFMRVGSFNPPDWAPNTQTNEGEFSAPEPGSDQAKRAAQGSVGDTGNAALGVVNTPSGPEGQQNPSS